MPAWNKTPFFPYHCGKANFRKLDFDISANFALKLSKDLEAFFCGMSDSVSTNRTG